MKKIKNTPNLNRRNFLAGTASIAGLAATASVVPPVGRSSRMQDFFGKIYGKVANAQNWAFLVKFEKQNGEAEQELEFELKNILNGMKAFREKMMAMSSACK